MFRIGIDIGSTFTKYCIMNDKNSVEMLFTEKTPVRQTEYFGEKIKNLKENYPISKLCTCGYGRNNIISDRNVNELIALAQGCHYSCPDIDSVLDIGGQDTKLICQKEGKLNKFFVNDKCAAGSGMFLLDVCNLLEIDINSIDLSNSVKPYVTLSSVCAVFARSEIVKLISENVPPYEIINAAIWQILLKSKPLLGKIPSSPHLLISGGLSHLLGIKEFASLALERECVVLSCSSYLSAIGCSIIAK